MNELDQKINTHFPGLVVRKDLVKTVKGNATRLSHKNLTCLSIDSRVETESVKFSMAA